MDGVKIRQTFLKYFEERGHTVVGSSPLIPRNDPSLFFTNAGMVQFKNVFTGEETRADRRATTVQKCLRVSGKHNDLENVGVTPRHHTFFEMLGNFSFGDYFKRDAIRYAWDLLTRVYGLDGDKLTITVFHEDDEAYALWRDEVGIPEKRIGRLGEKDNFWAMGDTGPCGPCSEIHIDKMAHAGKGSNPLNIEQDPEGYLEIWNLVFMQYERSSNGVLTPLPRPSIDTGMGLERLASILQGRQSNYDTDFFMPVIDQVARLSGHVYGKESERDVSMRVIADHSRSAAFLIADGVMPSNEERGYVLRRIMRRAIRHGVKLGLNEPFLVQTVETVSQMMGDAYPELGERLRFIQEVVLNEEQQFARTLDKGLRLYKDQVEQLKAAAKQELPGEFAFRLSDTYGFPLDLTQIIAAEDQLTVDEEGYRRELDRQREMARKAWKGSGEEAVAGVYQSLRAQGVASRFVGYDHTAHTSPILALLKNGEPVDQISAGDEVELVVAETPFYAESGGQIGDTGHIHLAHHHGEGIALEVDADALSSTAATLQIEDTRAPVEGVIIHRGKVVAGQFKVGDQVKLEVDAVRRQATRRNHSATHLLHAALREVLGSHVAQRGSLVAPDRLRFDFSHFRPMTAEELRQVEDIVNDGVLTNVALDIRHQSLQDAMAEGVTALFGEKYGDEVRVVRMPGLSAELCGGTHVSRTGDIGSLRIVSEAGIQAGVRRIEAVTGRGSLEVARGVEDRMKEMAELMKVGVGEVPRRVSRLLEERRELEKQVEQLKRRLLQGGGGSSAADRTREVKGVKVLSMALEVDDPKALREQADRLRDSLVSGVVVLGAAAEGRATLLVAVTKDLTGRIKAGDLIKPLAAIVDGSGGGRPDMAQAGGKNPERLNEALDLAYAAAESLLS